jgi:PBP1b-binding outer membrane lipoprotein LpoB
MDIFNKRKLLIVKMKNMKKIILSLSLVLLFVSCAKEDNAIDQSASSQKVTSFEDYLKFVNADTKGQVLIQSISGLESGNNIYNMSTTIEGNNEAPLIISLDNRKFGNNVISKTSKNSNAIASNTDLSSFFGKKISFELQNKSINAKTTSATSKSLNNPSAVYIPQLLKSKVSGLVNGKVVAGTTITWNADSQNINGVILTMEYKVLTQIEASIVAKFPKDITGGCTKEDTGLYTITASDLSGFPDDSIISFFIGRTGYTIVNDKTTSDDVSVGGITAVRTDFHINK